VRVGIHVTVDGRVGRRSNWLRRLAETVEELGFDGLWMGDHIVEFAAYSSRHPYRPDGQHPSTVAKTPGRYEPLVALTAVAAWTSRLRVGTAVTLLTERNPIITAAMVTALDHLSEGRFDFGVGVGWLREEHEVLGVPFADRGRRCDEYLAAMKELWTADAATFHGNYLEFYEVLAQPQPLTRPHPPIYIGGHSRPALRRVARFGDGWMPVFVSGDRLKRCLDTLGSELGAARRDSASVAVMPMYVLDDPELPVQCATAIRHQQVCAELAASGVIFKPRLDERTFERTLQALASDLL
jgi:probable F420-dependent oxidoreductase